MSTEKQKVIFLEGKYIHRWSPSTRGASSTVCTVATSVKACEGSTSLQEREVLGLDRTRPFQGRVAADLGAVPRNRQGAVAHDKPVFRDVTFE